MVIIQIEGGLGNQLFQYALGLSLATTHTVVKYDVSKFQRQHAFNGYELERIFNLQATYSNAFERRIIKTVSKFRHKLFNHPYKEMPDWQWVYHPAVNSIRQGFLKGYWQSPLYFQNIRQLLLKQLQFPPLTDERNRAIAAAIQQVNTVSVHIRRGDYLNSAIDCAIAIDYYEAAIRIISQKVTSPHYVIFSDDIAWARQHFRENNTTFVDWNVNTQSYIDMQLMGLCRHNIIANSSFSWWGAWLNDSAEKIVIAPKHWMPQLNNSADIFPPGWIQLPNQFERSANKTNNKLT